MSTASYGALHLSVFLPKMTQVAASSAKDGGNWQNRMIGEPTQIDSSRTFSPLQRKVSPRGHPVQIKLLAFDWKE